MGSAKSAESSQPASPPPGFTGASKDSSACPSATRRAFSTASCLHQRRGLARNFCLDLTAQTESLCQEVTTGKRRLCTLTPCALLLLSVSAVKPTSPSQALSP